MKIISEKTSIQELSRELGIADEIELIKAVVDLEREIIALGGELHADEEALLLEDGSQQQNLWGINIYPDKIRNEWIEFDSMINIRPRHGNRSRSVEDPLKRQKIIEIVNKLL